jgi:hypothetical protein
MEKDIEGECTKLVMELLNAWLLFKDNHDLLSPKLECCQHSRDLFQCLDSLERWVRRGD